VPVPRSFFATQRHSHDLRRWRKKIGFPALGFDTIKRGNQKALFYCLLEGDIKPVYHQAPF
jgi:hypothetical protein